MSNYQPKDNTFTLFRNDKKEKETHPDYKGSALIDGEEFWLSAWIKDGKNGKFMSGSLQPKEQRQDAKQASYDRQKPSGIDTSKPAAAYFDDDHIPF